MSAQLILELRKEELHRRVKALPTEVKKWQEKTKKEVDSNLHYSQLNAIGTLMDAYIGQQEELLSKMDPAGDVLTFQNDLFELIKKIIQSQRTWDFFRDKLDLRYSPIFKEVLWVTDTVAWNCYHPVLINAANAGILERTELREPPLTYLTAEFSPATWVRGSRPNDGREYHLGLANLPIPVIELPWDHMRNSWEFMSLHHEVGHDLEADLKLRPLLIGSLQAVLSAKGVPNDRIQLWLTWQGEVFADLVALQLGGPAYLEALMHLLLLPAPLVVEFDQTDPHPTPYIRILLNAVSIPWLIPGYQSLVSDSQQIIDQWMAIYGNQPSFTDLRNDFTSVLTALMDTPFAKLKGMTVRQLMPYSMADDMRIRNAIAYMRTGMNVPGNLQPRHCISAARLAVTQAALNGALSTNLLDGINKRAMDLVKSMAEPGMRGGDDSAQHKRFIVSFATGM